VKFFRVALHGAKFGILSSLVLSVSGFLSGSLSTCLSLYLSLSRLCSFLRFCGPDLRSRSSFLMCLASDFTLSNMPSLSLSLSLSRRGA
jgi:hypothetical protein